MTFILGLLMLSCEIAPELDAIQLQPEPIGLAECAVCGMVVGEQPSPRGQLAYRDGTHSFTCSIEEARALATAPGPLGRPVATWVEELPPDFDWRQTDVVALDWIPAADAYFVFGAERRLVMGVPVLTYGDVGEASRISDELGTVPVAWQALLSTPVPDVPPQSEKEIP